MDLMIILGLLQAASALAPQLARTLPIVERMLSGAAPSDEDIAALQEVTAELNAQADKLETQ